ncbi:MAG: two-component system aerobic respiration control sensor histidine kinase ArcB [Candidatus Krumholzibacteriia bacterium]|jgi:two-component system aerobic respiration control sensor histidine kinase ArcB
MADSESHPHRQREPQTDSEVTLASVVHDVNQMLAVIVGRSGLLESQVDNAELLPHLRAIGLAAKDAGDILNRLARRGSAQAISPSTHSLHEIAEQSRLLVWPQDKPQFQLQNQLDPEMRTAVPDQIVREVLNNLLLNSVAAMRNGGKVVLRSVAAQKSESVVVRVSDNGPGLPNNDQEWIFGAGNSSHDGPERGIGLAGCRHLLAQAGGQLVAELQSGGGAVFAMTLPIASDGQATAPAEVLAAPLPDAVLVVEDEASVREMMTEVFANWGCRVFAYRDAESAVADYKPGAAQVAVLDQNLPGLSGTDLASRLRKDDSCLSIVLASGWRDSKGFEPDRSTVDFVAGKPLDLPNLKRILQEASVLEQNRTKDSTDDEAI